MTNWKSSKMLGFTGALSQYYKDNFFIAKWDHSLCRGWQLYIKIPRRSQQVHLQNAGPESLNWSDKKAQQWADEQIKSYKPKQD